MRQLSQRRRASKERLQHVRSIIRRLGCHDCLISTIFSSRPYRRHSRGIPQRPEGSPRLLRDKGKGASVKANEVLLSATDIIGDRGRIYGHPRINQTRIALRLQQMLEVPISDHQACLAMVEVKLARLQETADHIDSYIDACAYLALACELITEKDENYV